VNAPTVSEFDRVESAAAAIRARWPGIPDAAIVLGSGLGHFAARAAEACRIAYRDLPHWPSTTVAGHAGALVIGGIAERQVAILSGRIHVYEGRPVAEVVFATRVMARLGIRTLILTNAAGGMGPALEPGVLMVIDDHINLLGISPLAGGSDDRFGPRFPDMTEVYSRRLRQIADAAAAASGVAVTHGVYAAVHGPSYETPAEVRYLRTVGADAVGMSTVPEAIVARQMGMEVLGLSCITNLAAGISPHPLTHEDVLATAARVRGRFTTLLEAVIARLPAERHEAHRV
jgi:purine-nucleoside phosphorylase